MANILVLTPRFPYPIVAGDTLRIYHLCEQLATEHSLTLLSLCGSTETLDRQTDGAVFDRIERVYHPRRRSWYQTIKAFLVGNPLQLGYYWSPKFARRIDALIPEHDLVLAHLIRTGQYVEDRKDIPCILEMTDAISLNYERVARFGRWSPKEMLYRIEAPRMRQYERRTVHKFELVSLVSEVDHQFLLENNTDHQSETATDHVRVYTNGIDLEARSFSPPSSQPKIVFIGNMRTVHNRMSCEFFVNEVLPMVQSEIPNATFKIVGAASESVRQLYADRDGVEVSGWVDSIPEATKDAFCGIGVMKVGGGVQNKILEYMALGIPVVANTIGVEGINLEPGSEVCVADTASEIAAEVIDLFRDRERRLEMAERARTFVETHHSWTTALRPFVEDVNNLLADSLQERNE